MKLDLVVLLTSLTALILSSIIIGSINADATFGKSQKGKDARRSAVIILLASIIGVLVSGYHMMPEQYRSQLPKMPFTKSYIF